MTMSAHDRYLAQYHCGREVVWCSNPKCEIHEGGMEVGWESEYGQSWWDIEECPLCGAYWLDDKPVIDDEDDSEKPQDAT
jgi:hypothetical protein